MGADVVQGAVSDTHERARKIDPRFTEGELVRVAGGRHQAEAEMIQGMLLEEGVPSILKRSPGFDVPDFLAAGPRDVMVPAGRLRGRARGPAPGRPGAARGTGPRARRRAAALRLTVAIARRGGAGHAGRVGAVEFGG